jgi:hypothetical protein
MKLLPLSLFLCFPLLLFAQEQGFPIIRNYTPKEYDHTPQVFSVVQDSKGITYFGLNGLVMQYDGNTWITTPISNKSSIYSLALDKNETLYIGGTSDFGYFKKDMQGKLTFESLTHLLPPNFKYTSVWQTIILKDEVYFRTFEGIFRYKNNPKPEIKLFEAEKDFPLAV